MFATPVPHVLHVVNSFNQGGSEKQAVQLIRMLHASGRYRVSVAVQNGRGPLRGEVASLRGVELTEYPLTSFYDRNALRQWARFRQQLREQSVDVVHTHDFYSNIFGLIGAAGSVRVRIASRRETTGTRTRMQKRVERATFHLAGAIVANSRVVRAQLVQEGVAERKIAVIYNGVELPPLEEAMGSRAAQLRSVGLPADQGLRFVTLVANLRLRVKDHPMFLKAAADVAKRQKSARFVIAGEGPLAEEIRQLSIDLGISDRVLMLGECNRVQDLLEVSDVCVLSSRAEGFSNAILEYLAAARPVVVTDVGGAREVIEDGRSGFLVQSGDATGMAACIDRLLDAPELAEQMGRCGRRVVEARFSPAARLRETENLYRGLMRVRSK